LLARLLTQVAIEQASAAMTAAINGALKVAPELAAQETALRQAAAGVVALLTAAAADHTQRPTADVVKSIATPVATAAAPLLAAAKLLQGRDHSGPARTTGI
jgi:hypothetical protein